MLIISEYEMNNIGYERLIEILHSYIMRSDRTSSIDNNLFQPYPEELQSKVAENWNKDYWKNK